MQSAGIEQIGQYFCDAIPSSNDPIDFQHDLAEFEARLRSGVLLCLRYL
jgi:hypothetical protein